MRILPIMLRSFGRSGSTLLMQILGSNNNVLFDRTYPYENRHLTYLYRLSKLIGRETNNSEKWGPDSIFQTNLDYIGPVPYRTTEVFDRKQLSSDLLMRIYNGFSKVMLDNNEQHLDLANPVYYAEKVVMDICDDINHMVDAKNLFLLRDPRDEFLSIKSFNKKRNTLGFGWNSDDTDESFALKLCDMRKDYIKHCSTVKNDSRRLFLKYEDVMQSPYEKTEEISNWLELELDYSKVEENKKNVEHHITSHTTEARWKSEMPENIKKIFEDKLGENLSNLGYEV